MPRGTNNATRPLTMRVPIATEEERALFQRRLALTGAVVFVLSFGFFALAVAIVAIFVPAHLRQFLDSPSSPVHVATSLAACGIWLFLRRTKRSVAALAWLDVALAVGLCLGWAALAISGIPLPQRPELIALLACSFTLVVRAALIPSSPARTAVLGAVGLTVLVVLTVRLYTRNPVPADIGLPPPINVAIWGILGVAATTVISHVIYGLSIQVRKAMQLGQYVLEDKIGAGGMGVVYRARHAMLRRPTAIKLLSNTTSQAAERFEREVQITARLTHPNTVAVYDYGRTPEGVFYYAMEYLDGISLEDLVIEHGPQSPRRVAHILVQICGALEEAHRAGLVHRDIKPANAMLTERGGVLDVVKVLDFGLVKETASAAEKGPQLSVVNTIVGTPHYMAPETIREPTKIDGRADLYAVGATAYFLLTGETVFAGKSVIEICSQHLHEAPVPPSKKRPDLPAALEAVILACLAKAPSDRPPDAATVAARVQACDLGEWSQAEARAWWKAQGRGSPGAASASKVQVRSGNADVSAFGQTIAVALDDRRAG